MSTFKVHMVALCVVIVACEVAYGGTLAYEGFNYGTAGLNSQTGGTGFSGAWSASGVETAASSIGFPAGCGLSTFGGRVEADMSGCQARRTLNFIIDTMPEETTVYYFSLLFKRTDSSNGSTGESMGLLRLQNASNQNSIIFGTGSDESVFVSIYNGGTLISNSATSSGLFEIGKVYMMIGKLIVRTGQDDEVFIKLYDSSADCVFDEPVYGQWDIQTRGSCSDDISKIQIVFGSEQDYVSIDELHIGTSWQNVVAPQCFAYEGFNYAGASLNGQTGGVGFSNSWNAPNIETSTSSLFAPDGYAMAMTSGKMYADMNSNDATREFAFNIDMNPEQMEVYYFSVLFKRNDNINQTSGEAVNLLRFRNSSNQSVAAFLTGSAENLCTQLYDDGTLMSSASTANNYFIYNENQLVIGKLIARNAADGNDEVYAKIINCNSGKVKADFIYEEQWDVHSSADCNDVIMKLNINFGLNQTEMAIDEIRIGKSWSDVVNQYQFQKEPISSYLRDTYLKMDQNDVQIIEDAEDENLMSIKPILLPEADNIWGGNIHFGWPVAARVNDTIVVHSRRKICHYGCDDGNSYSGDFIIISMDRGQTWSKMININRFWDLSDAQSIGGMTAIGVTDQNDFIIEGDGLLRSENDCNTWIVEMDTFSGLASDAENVGPVILNHPIFGLMIFNGMQSASPYKAYIRYSLDDGSTWRERYWTDSISIPREPASVTWNNHILLVSREFNEDFGSDGKTFNMTQHLYTYIAGDDINAVEFETQRTNIAGNLWNTSSSVWSNDTADLIYNPVTERIELLHSSRFGGQPGYDGNNTKVYKSSLLLWSIDPDELLAGSNVWRFEGTLLQRNSYVEHNEESIDGLHPGASVVDLENNVQHIFLYMGKDQARCGIFQLTRTLNTPLLRNFLEDSYPNYYNKKKFILNADDASFNMVNSCITLRIDETNPGYSNFKANHSDLYFTDANGYMLRHKTLRWYNTSDSLILVEVPYIPAGATNECVYMHWGDPNANFYEYDDFANPTDRNFSISFWIKNYSTDGLYYAVNKGNNSGSAEAGWCFFREATNKFRFRLQGNYTVTYNNFIDTANWHHVVGVIDRDNNNMALYMDGYCVGTASISAVTSISTSEELHFEYSTGTCLVQDLMVIPQALTSTQVSEIYTEGRNSYVDLSLQDP